MSVSLGAATSLATDARALDALRQRAGSDPRAAVQHAAKQFETLFMQQLLKSMRDATMATGMLDNAGTQMGTELLDAQYATSMAGLPGGLADLIARQLERHIGAGPAAPAEPSQPMRTTPDVPLAFVDRHAAAARAVEAESGIPASFMIGQAAHESGWGRHEIRHADGRPAHNLFGIKAGPGWKGAVAEVTTTEYIDGQPRKQVARFRAYASYEESFRDYARLISESPRYAGVMDRLGSAPRDARAFAEGLQQAGYATDPAYANKLTRVINTTLQLQRALS